MIKRRVFICFVFFILYLPASASETINVAAPAFLPFNGIPSSRNEGYMVEVFRKIFEKEGFRINYEVMPRRRSLLYLKSGRINATFLVNKTDYPDFVYPEESFGFVQDTFYTRKNTKWRFVGTDSLKDVKVGGFYGYPYGYQIKRFFNGNSNVEILIGRNTLERNLLKLMNRRIDVLIATPQIIRWVSKGFYGNVVENRGIIGNEKKIYAAFSPSKRNSVKFSNIFSKGLRDIRKTGELTKILKKYNQIDWKPSLRKSRNKILTIVQLENAQNLDPAMATNLYSFEVINNIYEGLVKYTDESTNVEPCLAIDWSVSDDNRTWIFNLRKDVRFHDGTLFDSKAVVKSFRRQFDKKSPLYRKGFAYAKIAFANVRRVTALGRYKVKIELSNPYAPFIYNLAMVAAKIISPKALRHPEKLKFNPVGTGPFRLSSLNRDSLSIVRYDRYWGSKAYIKKAVFQMASKNIIFRRFKDGVVDVISDLPPEKALSVCNRSKLLLSPVMHVAYLAINTMKKPLDDVNIRKALNHAVPKKQLVKDIFSGFAFVSKTSIPPSMWGHNGEIEDFEYNIKKAKAMAGKVSGLGTLQLWVADKPVSIRIGKKIAGNLRRIGLRVSIVKKRVSEFYKGVKNGEHDLAFLDWFGDNGDPDNFLYALFDKDNTVKGKASNRSFLKDEILHKMLIKAQRALKKKVRIDLYKAAQQRIRALAPWIHLYHKQMLVGVKRKVNGVIVHPTGSILLHKAWVE